MCLRVCNCVCVCVCTHTHADVPKNQGTGVRTFVNKSRTPRPSVARVCCVSGSTNPETQVESNTSKRVAPEARRGNAPGPVGPALGSIPLDLVWPRKTSADLRLHVAHEA
jgi:hypothetical protein